MGHDLLLEMGVEELPSASVLPLAQALAKLCEARLTEAKLCYKTAHYFAMPRRLAIIISDLDDVQPNYTISRRGPASKAAVDADGKPTKALLGFAKSCAVPVDELTLKETDKGGWWYFEAEKIGSKTVELLPDLVADAIKSLPVKKFMSWGEGAYQFARPVHWVLLSFANQVVPATLFGLSTGNKTYGHRFHHPQAIEIEATSEYESKLNDAFVVASFEKRRDLIIKKVQALASKSGYQAVMPEALVDEVTSIVEWPEPLMVPFDKRFLEVPAAVLIASMQAHQKCFALENKAGELQPYFITVSNIQSKNPEQVIAGNEKVMRARLSDAAFFYQQDKKQPLGDYRELTAKVIFQKGLGSLNEKSERMRALVKPLAKQLKLDAEQGDRAAFLSKCDLMTGMVGEFPELQGLMGADYAIQSGENKAVALALDEQYKPRFASDELPKSKLGFLLSLVDRLDILVGNFAIGQRPTGEKDPFKLRRHALAVARLLIDQAVPLKLSELIDSSLNAYGDTIKAQPDTRDVLKTFIFERLQSYYQAQGITQDIVQAARASQNDCLYDLDRRIMALRAFTKLPEAVSLTAACKRVHNILHRATDAEKDGEVNSDRLEEPAEQALHVELMQVADEFSANGCEDYVTMLHRLATLREPVDAFFEDVMVMAEDTAIRKNRVALLQELNGLLQQVADISLLAK